jgi:hypothetical protein
MQALRDNTIGTDAMASATNSQSAGNWPELQSGPLITGGVLIGIGAVVALVGMGIAGAHVAAATRTWMRELETPPSELARLKWEQAKSTAAAGASHWRQHPNAKVGIARRGSAS